MKKKLIALCMFLAVLLTSGLVPVSAKTATGVTYQTHVQTYGWQKYVKDGATSGTSGQAKRLEGIRIKLTQKEYSGSIQYRTHIQTYGWEKNWKSNGAMSGTSGQAKRLEAIQIRLTGDIAKKYDVYYRVHAQTYGWLGWTKNGAMAGTAGYAKRLEAIQIKLVKKGATAPSEKGDAYKDKNHTTHSYTKKISHKDSTCKTKGYDIYQCTVCGKTNKKVLALSTKHSYKFNKKVAVTCEEDGYKLYKCSTCGKLQKRAIEEKLGHDFSKYEGHYDPTCTEGGYDLYKCVRCKKTHKEITEKKLGHEFDNKMYDYKKGGCLEPSRWYVKCIRCGQMQEEEDIPGGHNYRLQKETKPTCTKDGYKYYKCGACGEEKTEKTASKLGHDFSNLIEHKDSTCKTKGYDLYQCTRCSQKKKNELGYGNHNYVETASDDAETTYTCSTCGKKNVQSNDQEYTIDLGNGETETVTGHFAHSMEAEIFDMLNEYRAEKGLSQLSEGSEALKNAADIRAVEITYSFSHTRPNGERALTSFNATTGCCAENLGRYQKSSAQVMDGWKNSGSHNSNMLSSYPTTVSISVFAKYERMYEGNRVYSYHFVQLFGW